MTTKTFRLSAKAMDRPWHVVDAKGRPLGRVASEVARLLMGKHKPTYERHLPMGDYVIVINAREVAVTGDKMRQKIYYRHSGYPGGLKERTLQEQMDRDPRRVLEKAIKGMLPSTSLGRELFRHLHVYAGPTHPHAAQVNAGTARPKQAAAPVMRAPSAAAAAAPVDEDAEATAPAAEESTETTDAAIIGDETTTTDEAAADESAEQSE